MDIAISEPARVHFPNLNSLRFFAALLVIVHHVEQFKMIFGLPSSFLAPVILVIGKLGVLLFFVLSGFLITYLLLHEKRSVGTIAVRDFYVRRCLRIWPLYYLVVTMSLLLLPRISFLAVPGWTEKLPEYILPKAVLMFALLPNLAAALYPPIAFASQAWSVGVEEQFYLMWPWVVKSARNLYPVLFFISGLFLVVRIPLLALELNHPQAFAAPLGGALFLVWQSFNIDCMAIGGLAAVIYFEARTAVLSILFSRWTQVGAYALTLALIARGFSLPQGFHHPVYAVLFAILILNLACNPRRVISLDNRLFNYLGKISYGLYMFHPLAIVITLRVLLAAHSWGNVAHYSGSLALTILLATMSYELFERRFLKAKVRFSRVATGDAVEA